MNGMMVLNLSKYTQIYFYGMLLSHYLNLKIMILNKLIELSYVKENIMK